MRAQERKSARRHLDNRLNLLRKDADMLARPPRGWIKAIREALGMTATQLGQRIGVSQPRALAIEKAEADGRLTLETLERAAHALDCRLVYALVPREPLETLAEERAALLARKRLQSTYHTMALEAQSVEEGDEEEQLRQMVRRLLERPGSALWED
jgi:predicted DNA-binding mobile mystery protein A